MNGLRDGQVLRLFLEQILPVSRGRCFAVTSAPDELGHQELAGKTVATSFIQRLPFGAKHPQMYFAVVAFLGC